MRQKPPAACCAWRPGGTVLRYLAPRGFELPPIVEINVHAAGAPEDFSEPRRVSVAFRLGEIPLGRADLSLRECQSHFTLLPAQEPDPATLASLSVGGSDGVLIRSQPLPNPVGRIRFESGWIRYAPRQYRRCTTEFRGTFAEYLGGFSAKSRSTMGRKVRKFAEAAGASGGMRTYRTAAELEEFFRVAEKVSALTYQERLLDAGLPTDEAFRRSTIDRAASDQIRAYLLFAGDRPVAYLFCPAWKDSDILLYEFLGYDPEFRNLSPGTVLQYLALEQLFGEGKFSMFDFLEGETDQKQLFSTKTTFCADLYYLRKSPRTLLIVAVQTALEESVGAVGRLLDALKLKSRIRNLIRRGMPGTSADPPKKP